MNIKERRHQPIGIFDSGVGGLTVVKEIMQRMPHEDLIYFGDTARVPYGGKSQETIVRYSIESAIFLMEQNIKMLVIACNTVSAYAVDRLQKIFNIPIIEVILPGAEKAAKVTKNKHLAVLGTKATVQSDVYRKEIQKLLPEATVRSVACPMFVPLVEERFIDHPAAQLIVKEYLKEIRDTDVDTVLLGCTHYPMLKKLIAKEIGKDVHIVDSATTCAEKVEYQLKAYEIEGDIKKMGHTSYYVSDDPLKFQIVGQDFLGHLIDYVSLR